MLLTHRRPLITLGRRGLAVSPEDPRARVRVVARRAVRFLLVGLLLFLPGAALATPPEPLHLVSIQDGGDYDSLIRPLLLALIGLPDGPLPLVTPLGPIQAHAGTSVPAAPGVRFSRSAPSRAPPVSAPESR